MLEMVFSVIVMIMLVLSVVLGFFGVLVVPSMALNGDKIPDLIWMNWFVLVAWVYGWVSLFISSL